jgi:Zn-dependent protease
VDDIVYKVSIWALPVLLAITVHEAAHGWVAWRCGDDTAYRLGRVTFNPLRHIDPIGTVLLPAMLLLASGGQVLFGFAKPVPVNFGRLRHPRRDSVLVAAAGPGVNIAMACAAGFLIHLIVLLPESAARWVGLNLLNAVWINVLLAVFNMLPIPPLDGGRVAVGLLPPALSLPLARIERFGIMVVLGVLLVLPMLGRALGLDLDLFAWLVVRPAVRISDGILALAGIA